MEGLTRFCVRKPPQTVYWQAEFDGVLQSGVRSALVEELIKFIAFERRQLPATFDSLKYQEDEKRKRAENAISEEKENQNNESNVSI